MLRMESAMLELRMLPKRADNELVHVGARLAHVSIVLRIIWVAHIEYLLRSLWLHLLEMLRPILSPC